MDVIGILNTQAATEKITIENTDIVEAQQEIVNDFIAGKAEAALGPKSKPGSSKEYASNRESRATPSHQDAKPSFSQQMQDELDDFKQ